MPRPAALNNRRKWQLIGKSQWCCSANCGHPLHALTYNWTRVMQLANTPPLQSTTPGLHSVSFHQTSPLVRGSKHPITAYYSVYRPRKDERLSWPGWLVTYRNKVPSPGVEPGHVTHPSTNRARRRVTSLIRPTLLPLRHAANQRSNVCESVCLCGQHTDQWAVQNGWTDQDTVCGADTKVDWSKEPLHRQRTDMNKDSTLQWSSPESLISMSEAESEYNKNRP